MFNDWPRIPVDTSSGNPFHRIESIAVSAATRWALGPDGPHKQPQSLAQTVSSTVHEALLHLTELGLIDIDVARMDAARGIPPARMDFRPDVEPPQHLGNGANAETCPACKGTNPPYPFICPGPTGNPDTEAPAND
jgi:hypothetical protein